MLLGIIEAAWGGVEIPLKPGSSFDLGGVVSSPQVVGETVDFSNAMKASEIKLKVAVQKGVRITDTFPSGIKQELQVRCDSGQMFVWSGAFRSGSLPVTTGDGSEIEVMFSAGAPLEI